MFDHPSALRFDEVEKSHCLEWVACRRCVWDAFAGRLAALINSDISLRSACKLGFPMIRSIRFISCLVSVFEFDFKFRPSPVTVNCCPMTADMTADINAVSLIS